MMANKTGTKIFFTKQIEKLVFLNNLLKPAQEIVLLHAKLR